MLFLSLGVQYWSLRAAASAGDVSFAGVLLSGLRFFWPGVYGMLVKLAIN